MSVSDAVLVFVLIYLVVMAALYLASRYWAVLRAGRVGSSQSQSVPPPLSPEQVGTSTPYSFRQGAPRPPRLRPPPVLELSDEDSVRGHAHRLSLATGLVGYVASANPTGFPLGLFREWYEARMMRPGMTDGSSDVGQAMAAALHDVPSDAAAYEAVVAELAASATYAELADLVHFCGEAFAAAKAGSPVHVAVHDLSDRLAVVVGSVDQSPAEDDDRLQLERKLEVDFLTTPEAKIAHLRRMHGFFRSRLIALRDDISAERRGERMADYRRHMEEQERLLRWLGSQP